MARIDRRVSPNQTALWTIYELVSIQAARGVWKIRSGAEDSTGDGNRHRVLRRIVGAVLRSWRTLVGLRHRRARLA
jgi:hypothetical protein